METLKLVALDKDDLEVISAHVQDAVVKVSDVLWRPGEQRLVVALNRFDWELAQGGAPEFQRRRSALRFDRVRSCKCRNVDPKRPGPGLEPFDHRVHREGPSGRRGDAHFLGRRDVAARRRVPRGRNRRPRPGLDDDLLPHSPGCFRRERSSRQRNRSPSATSSASLTSLWNSSRMTRAVCADR